VALLGAAALTGLVGRRVELERLEELLRRHRLLTVIGSGGVGKTRLAIEAARRVGDRFQDGVVFVELAQISNGDLVATAAAEALGVADQKGVGVSDAVCSAVGRRHLLLVLDNCEHVIDSAAEFCGALLGAGEDLRVLATSREGLGVAGEIRFSLDPLPVPPDGRTDAIEEFDAVALFVDRACQADPAFVLDKTSAPLVADLVRRLDGMPLAVELACAQLDVVRLSGLSDAIGRSTDSLLSVTRGVPARQASLAASIDWSYRLLSDQEQWAFRRLSVFPAPFTAVAARAVVGDNYQELLARLVRRSMVVAPALGRDGQHRYSMLQTLRSYADDQLQQSGDAALARSSVAEWALRASEEASARMDATPSDEIAAALWFDSESDNLRASLTWALAHSPGLALRLAVALAPWWELRGNGTESVTLLEEALAGSTSAGDWTVPAAHLWLGSVLRRFNGRRALEHASLAVELAGQLDAGSGLVGDAMFCRTRVLMVLGHYERALAEADRLIRWAASGGDTEREALGHLAVAEMFMYQERFGEAVPELEKTSGTMRPRMERLRSQMRTLALLYTGDTVTALGTTNEPLEAARAIGDATVELWWHEMTAEILIAQGDYHRAVENLSAAFELNLRAGSDPLHTAQDLWFAADVCAANGQLQAAATLITAGDSFWDQAHLANPLVARYKRKALEAVNATLRQPELSIAEQRGLSMTLVEAIEFAQSQLAAPEPKFDPGGVTISRLSRRETEVVLLVGEGVTDREIAEKLFISIRTVRSHLDRIRDKTGCRRRADLTRLAVDLRSI
jgi:non-specific serine/threonine protein kinase